MATTDDATFLQEASSLLNQMPEFVEQWPATIKMLLPAATLGYRTRLIRVLKELQTEADDDLVLEENHGEGAYCDLVLEGNHEAPAATPPPPPIKCVMSVPLPPASWSHEQLVWYEVVHSPQVMVRSEPSVSGKIYGILLCGDIIAIETVHTNSAGQPWARLAEPERHGLQINLQIKEYAPDEAFVLLDGTSIGLGTLLRPANPLYHPPRYLWDLKHRLCAPLPTSLGDTWPIPLTARGDTWQLPRRTCRQGRAPMPHGPPRACALLEDPSCCCGGRDWRDAPDECTHAPPYWTPCWTARRLHSRGVCAPRQLLSSLQRRAEGLLFDRPCVPLQQYLSCWLPSEDCLGRSGEGRLGTGGGGASRLLLGTSDGSDPFPSAVHPPTPPRAPPRVAIALLLRGAPASCVSGWCAYHLAVGFTGLYLYFDDPHEAAAIDAARRFEPRAKVVLCTPAFWQVQRGTNAFFRDGRGGNLGGNFGGLSAASFEKGDVQSRQCVAVQEAVARATADGYDWLLHVDIDELWFSPSKGAQRDAPSAFALAPADVHELVFMNHEAVPRYDEGADGCWFTHQTLFKVHGAFTRTDSQNGSHEIRASRRRREDEAKEALREARVASNGGMSDDDEEEDDEEDEVRALNEVCDLYDHDTMSLVLVHLSRERARRMRVEGLGDESSVTLHRQWRKLRMAGEHSKARAVAKRAKQQAKIQGSSFGYFTAHEQGKAAVRLRVEAGGEPVFPPPSAGIHRWSFPAGRRSHTCYGAGAPVVLHYPNASFAYWQAKYRMLTTATNFAEGRQISLKSLNRVSRALERIQSCPPPTNSKATGGAGDEGDEGAADGTNGALAGLVKEREHGAQRNINGMHDLAAALVQRAETTKDPKDLKLVEGVYRQQFCVTDMLPPLASRGLLVEINAVREIVLSAIGDEKSQLNL